jgi:hypothetical protein
MSLALPYPAQLGTATRDVVKGADRPEHLAQTAAKDLLAAEIL